MNYLILSAKNNDDMAQYMLGLHFYRGINMNKNINDAFFWFKESAKHGNMLSNFSIGFIFHKKKIDIKQAIHYYNEASSLNDNHAKNNLGVIYKNGFGDKIMKNLGNAEVYFQEAIKQKNDYLSMYNLSSLYIYDMKDDKYIDKSIELLIKSFNYGFSFSGELLCIVLYNKFGFNIKKFEQEISKYTNNFNKIVSYINNSLQKYYGAIDFYIAYMKFKNINFVYDLNLNPEISMKNDNMKRKCISKIKNNQNNITKDFYEGFGNDIL